MKDYSSSTNSSFTNSSSTNSSSTISTYLTSPVLKITSLALASFLLMPSVYASEGSLASKLGSTADTTLRIRSFQRPRNSRTQTTLSQTAGRNQDNPIVAAARTFFQPPSNPRPRSGSQTSMGTRQGSCLADADTSLAALGPSSVVGRTTSSRPSFTWYLPPVQTSPIVQFRLLAPDESGIPVAIHTAHLDYASGYSTYQIPDDVPALVDGVEYRWQVIVACDPNSPSRSIGQELSIEKVAASPSLMQSISSSDNAIQQALAYGRAGIWYDAIAAVAQAQTIDAQVVRAGFLQDLAVVESEQENVQRDFLEDLLELAGVGANRN